MKKLILVLMVLVYSVGYSQYTITLEVPEMSGVTPGETIVFPVTCTAISPDPVSSFYIYLEWDDAVLDFVSAEMSPEMLAYTGVFSFFFASGSQIQGLKEACVGSWSDLTPTGTNFLMSPGDVFFNVTCIYQGDGVVGTPIDFQFSKQALTPEGSLAKGVTEILSPGVPAILFTTTPVSGSVNMAVATGFVWDGGGDGMSWDDQENWDPTGLPGDADDVTINADGKAPLVHISGAASCAALTVATGAGIQIDVAGELTTNGLYTNDGDLIIASDVLGYSGSFIDMGGLAGTGNYSFNRDVVTTAAYGAMGGWHYLSTPITGFENWDMFDYFVNAFDGAAQMFNPIEGTYTPEPGVPCDPAPQTVLGNMEAWSIKQDVTYATGTNFLGYLDDCETEYPGTDLMIELAGPFANVNTGAFGPAAVFTGWNFYGNPYSSDIDPSLIAYGPNTIQSIAMWDGLSDNYYYSSAAVWANNIAPTQGFFVEATGPDNFALAGTERVHSGAFWGKSEISNLLTLQATGNDKSDVLYVRFMDELTPAFDSNGDAHKLLTTVAGVPQIYTTVGSEMLAINALPSTDQVPMGFTSIESGSFTIEAIETSEFSEVYLQDLLTGEVTDMLATDYSFEYTAGENANRFIIHFAPVGINDISAGTVKIWALDNNIIVNVPVDVTGEIAVFNIMGQEIARTEIESVETQIPVSDVNTYYVVKVISNSNAVTGKVYVK